MLNDLLRRLAQQWDYPWNCTFNGEMRLVSLTMLQGIGFKVDLSVIASSRVRAIAGRHSKSEV